VARLELVLGDGDTLLPVPATTLDNPPTDLPTAAVSEAAEEPPDATPEAAPDATPTVEPADVNDAVPVVPATEPSPPPVFSQDPRPLTDVTTAISAPGGSMPKNAAAAEFPPLAEALREIDADRGWAGFGYQWEASATVHRPLYFEEINAERYGYSRCRPLQPAISGARFFATVPALPYKMTAEPRCECVYPLGHYRPGSCAPHRPHCWPLQPKAGLIEAGAVTGLIFVVP